MENRGKRGRQLELRHRLSCSGGGKLPKFDYRNFPEIREEMLGGGSYGHYSKPGIPPMICKPKTEHYIFFRS